jgi:phospholipid/cholesterol/gamma-HCH transport system substrate-binding protein
MAAETSTIERQRQRRRLLVGRLLMAGLIATALLIFFMEDIVTMFDEEYAIVVVFPGAAGLTEGSPVWVSGREVGTVTSVGFMPSSSDSLARVVLHLLLPVDVQSQVRADSRIRLTSIGFVSEKVVDILPGTAGSPVLAPGDTLRQEPLLTPQDLTHRAGLVSQRLDTVMAELRIHVPGIRARLLQTQRAFAGLDGVMAEAGRLQADMDASPGLAVLRDPAFETSLRNARAHAAELPVLIRRLRENAGAASEMRTALARLQLRADSLGMQLAAASLALENPNGTLARMQQDTALTRALNAARAQLDSLMADMRSNPLRYVF